MMMTDETTSTTTAADSSPTASSKRASAPKRKPANGGASKKKSKAAAKKSTAGKAKIAKGTTYALVARLGPEVYRKAWNKVEKLSKAVKPGQPRISMSSWLTSVIAKAAK